MAEWSKAADSSTTCPVAGLHPALVEAWVQIPLLSTVFAAGLVRGQGVSLS